MSECRLEVMLLTETEQATLTQDIELPFVPVMGQLLKNLGAISEYDEDDGALFIEQVMWDDSLQTFWVNCGMFELEDQTLDEAIDDDWRWWSVNERKERVVENPDDVVPLRNLFESDDTTPGAQLIQPCLSIVAHRPEDNENEDVKLKYTIEFGSYVICKDGTAVEVTDDTEIDIELFVFESLDEVKETLKAYFKAKSKDPLLYSESSVCEQ